MNTASQILLTDVREGLVRLLSPIAGRANLEEAFTAWVLGANELGLSADGAVAQALAGLATAPAYWHPAVLGYAADKHGAQFQHTAALEEALTWVSGRDFHLSSSLAGFVSDPIAILGIALGSRALGKNDVRQAVAAWMSRFLGRSVNRWTVQNWEKCLFSVAAELVGMNPTVPVPPDPDLSAVRIALQARGLVLRPTREAHEEETRQAIASLKQILLGSDRGTPTACALQLAAYQEIIRMQLIDSSRTKVFISYSHKDTAWLDRLHVHLRPLEREGKVDRWDDTRIRTSQQWKEEVRRAIATAKVAVLLISADFLASDFIATDELPPLLAAAKLDGVKIMPVIAKPCRFSQTPSLSQFQAVNPGLKALISMTEAEQEELYVKLTDDVIDAIEGRI